MSQENVEIVRPATRRVTAKTSKPCSGVLDPEVEWHSALLKALEGGRRRCIGGQERH